MMLRGEIKPLELRKPSARSVELAVMPLAKLYAPPAEEPVSAPVPVVPAACVVAVVPAEYSVPFDTLNPVGRVAVALLPMPSKFWV